LWLGVKGKVTLLCGYRMATMWLMARKSVKPAAKVTKDEIVRMRVSTAQKTAMLEAASRDGLELSQWLRQLALRAAGALPGRQDS
jgi:hypothetical protein